MSYALTEAIESAYRNLTPLKSLELNFHESEDEKPIIEILGNGQPLSKDAETHMFRLARTPASYFQGLLQENQIALMRTEILPTLVAANTQISVFPGSEAVTGFMPEWKAQYQPTMKAIGLAPELFADVEIDTHRELGQRYRNVVSRMRSFKLPDSEFYLGPRFNMALFGDEDPEFSIDIQRTQCTNSLIASIALVKGKDVQDSPVDLMTAYWEVVMKACDQMVDKLPESLQKAMELPIDAQMEVLEGRLSSVSKRVRDGAPAYCQSIREGNQELPAELLDTSYGALNVVTACARSLPSQSMAKVASQGLNYLTSVTGPLLAEAA